MPGQKSTTFYIVRHGQSQANIAGIVGGDTGLTPQGEEQAREIGRKLKDIHFDAVFSSDRLRAIRTAEIISTERNLAVMAYRQLRERSYGIYEGISVDEYRRKIKGSIELMNKLPYSRIKKLRRYKTFETDDEVLARFVTFLREIAIGYPKKTILIASHATLMKTFLIHLGYADFHEMPPVPVSNTGFMKVEADGADFILKEVSGIVVLDSEKLDGSGSSCRRRRRR